LDSSSIAWSIWFATRKVQAEHVVRRLARAAPVDPHAVLQLVALPRLADGEPEEQRHDPTRSTVA
jgi:hypothetical protein